MVRYRCPACGLERDVGEVVPGTVVRHVACPDTLGQHPVTMTTEPHPCRPGPASGAAGSPRG